MFQIKVNKKLLPIKFTFFFLLGTVSPMVGFLPTIARQLGYSITTYGTVMMCMSIVSVILCPLIGIVGERIYNKKLLFFVLVLFTGLSSYLFMFVPKVPLDMTVKLQCDKVNNILIVTAESVSLKSPDHKFFTDNDIGEAILCNLHCRDSTVYYVDTAHQLYNRSDFQNGNRTIAIKYDKNHHSNIEITFNPNDVKNKNGSININVSSIREMDSPVETYQTTCLQNSNTFCNVAYCSNETIINLVATKAYKRNLFNLYQFWVFAFVIFFYWVFSFMACILQNPICLDMLEDKPDDFGKQKCWGSIGWGTSSIFVGWLVDRFSVNKKEKDYSPVFYSTVVLTVCNLIAVSKMRVVEMKKTNSKSTNVNYGLFASHNVIALFVWSLFNSFFHAIITHFLFWYMEDLVSENNDPDQRAYIKTLQGLAQGIQCFGGELPFFFWSGWIIRAMGGHVNCMALVLGAMAVRMYLYTVIWNPVWIIAIELLNGVSFALGFAVKMSFAKIISPPGSTFTVLGFLALCDMIGEGVASLLGGYLFGLYGGVWSFRFFACGSGVMCFISILSNKLGFMKEINDCNFIQVPTKSINTDESIGVDK